LTHEGVTSEVDKLAPDPILLNQIPYKIQHVFPAVKPLWRLLLSVLAAILVGLALRSLEKTILFCLLRRGWFRIDRRLVLVNCPESRAGASQGGNITHHLNPSTY
jgi:hypothetical protein